MPVNKVPITPSTSNVLLSPGLQFPGPSSFVSGLVWGCGEAVLRTAEVSQQKVSNQPDKPPVLFSSPQQQGPFKATLPLQKQYSLYAL